MIRFLEGLNNDGLTLRLLSVKVAILIVLTTGQRCQTLAAINLGSMDVKRGNHVNIRIRELLKQSKKKGKRKVQGVPQSQTAALPKPQEEEETDKSKQAQIEQTYEKH